jgi:RNA polymerase sigma-B factor
MVALQEEREASSRASSESERFAELARTGDPELRADLIGDHLGLAVHLARRFARRSEPLEDLVQVASVALIHAVDRYDPDRGVEFASFAVRTILGELKRHFRDKGWGMRPPRRVQELYLELRDTTTSLAQELGRPPTVPELAVATGASEEAVLEALEATYCYRVPSIDNTDRTDETIANRLKADDMGFSAVDHHSALAPALARLTSRERLILQLRFVEDLTQSEIAMRIGVSQMQVSRLLQGILARLREELAESPV